MKLVVVCLLAVCCASFASATGVTLERRKLLEVVKQLGDVKDSLERRELLVNTPPQNIEDCCCLSALRCFRASLHVQFNVTERKQDKLYRSLKHPITERALDFCKTGNAVSTCETCDSQPKATAPEFVKRLESLIQRAISRLSDN
ncbi:interleukin-21 [Hippocampus comes]|uniref:interleukin-21 n=1 Tax=Hippocampus comes TaxID=109280 RepID=UPI00094E0184|nr:PREDICTED: interleukin-21-like [Hippocampus comes]